MSDERFGQRNLRIAGWVLFGVGVASGVGSVLFAVVRHTARDCWWLAAVIVLLLAFRTDPLRRFAQAAGLLMLLIWLCFNIDDLSAIPAYITSRIDDWCLGLMLMILGVLILSTNDPHGQSRMLFRRWSSVFRTHRLKALAACVAMLWIVNPAHSHSMCLAASEICESHGAYGSAITLTRLARDTFPLDTFCGTCLAESNHDLSLRIASLSSRNRSQMPTSHDGSAESRAPSAVDESGNVGEPSPDGLPTMTARRGPTATRSP